MFSEKDVNLAEPPVDRPLLRTYPWLAYLLPLVVFLGIGSLEPAPPQGDSPPPAAKAADQAEPATPAADTGALSYRHYPLIYALKLALTLAAVVYVWPAYRAYPGRPGGLAIVVGVAGAIVWVALARWQLEPRLLALVGMGGMGERAAFNPFAAWPDQPGLAWGYLAMRFVGLAAVVPVVEEFFLRGFVMRWVQDPDWQRVPFPATAPKALAAGTLVPMLMHPAELLAAAIWFSGITWLMLRRRTIWDCVAAHAVTNLLLGVWVVVSGDWFLI